MQDKTGFFEERPGVKSNTRLNSSIIIYVGLIIGLCALILDRENFEFLSITLVGIGAGQKVIQKRTENAQKDSNNSNNS